ncbi:MAG: hypothetical protein KC912_26325 [Proteobacteria bacterium]|nr:hypothetical protein [Pseudomonadota bacterium]
MDLNQLWGLAYSLPPLIPTIVIGFGTLAAVLFAASGTPRARYVAMAGASALFIEISLMCVWRGVFMKPDLIDYEGWVMRGLQVGSSAVVVLAWLLVLVSAGLGRGDE